MHERGGRCASAGRAARRGGKRQVEGAPLAGWRRTQSRFVPWHPAGTISGAYLERVEMVEMVEMVARVEREIGRVERAERLLFSAY